MRRVALVALVACGHAGAQSARERVLAKLPADAGTVIAADARVLASPAVRGVIDVLRPRWPASLGCVVDTALASDQVGIAITADGTTIIGAGRASIPCAAVSRIDGDLWVATIGAGTVAGGKIPAVLDDPRFARARGYLVDAPIAATAESALLGAHVLATAQIDPLEAWLAIDAPTASGAALYSGLGNAVARLAREPTTTQLATKLVVSRHDTQVVVRLRDPGDVDLAAAARTVLGWLDAPTAHGDKFACPPVVPPITGCRAATELVVSSLPAVIDRLSGLPLEPIVSSGAVTGLRFLADLPAFGLQRGDQVVAAGGRQVTNRDQLVEALRRDPAHATLTIRRGTTLAVFTLDER